jgi:xylan 1,4-beta-xylosidase
LDVDSTKARNVILQRETSQSFTATTKLEFKPAQGAQAGLLCYYDTKTYIKFALTVEGGSRLVLEECRKGVKTVVGSIPVKKSRSIYLRVQVNGLSREFDYSHDGKKWQRAGKVADASFLSDQGTPQWGFMGTMTGVFSVNTNAEKRIATDFDWFNVDSNPQFNISK